MKYRNFKSLNSLASSFQYVQNPQLAKHLRPFDQHHESPSRVRFRSDVLKYPLS